MPVAMAVAGCSKDLRWARLRILLFGSSLLIHHFSYGHRPSPFGGADIDNIFGGKGLNEGNEWLKCTQDNPKSQNILFNASF